MLFICAKIQIDRFDIDSLTCFFDYTWNCVLTKYSFYKFILDDEHFLYKCDYEFDSGTSSSCGSSTKSSELSESTSLSISSSCGSSTKSSELSVSTSPSALSYDPSTAYLTRSNSNEYEFEIVEEIDNIIDGEKPVSKKRVKYAVLKVCESDIERIEFIKQLKIWAYESAKKNKLKTIETIYYRCTLVKKKDGQCARRLKVDKHLTSFKNVIFLSENEHNHELFKTTSMNDELKIQIIQLRDSGLGTAAISQHLAAQPTCNYVPTKKQIQNCVSNNNIKRENTHNPTVKSVFNWLTTQTNVPDDENIPFILNYTALNAQEVKDVRFVYSSKTLLSNAQHGEVIASDTTFKVCYTEMPLFILGTIDKAGHFHFLGVGACSHERQEDFEYFFQSIKDAVKKYTKYELKPSVLISDGSIPLAQAYYKVFAESAKINNMCHVHVARAAKRHIKGAQSKAMKDEFDSDFKELQIASSSESFAVGMNLFKAKWLEINKEFAIYFEEQWISNELFNSWGEHKNEVDKHNNALEAVNNVLKIVYIREKLPFVTFTQQLELMMATYSKDYSDGKRKYQLTIGLSDVDTSCWKMVEFYRRHKENGPLEVKVTGRSAKNSIRVFYMKSKNVLEKLDRKLITKYGDCVFTSFGEWSHYMNSIWRIEYDGSNVFKSKCTCSVFLKKHYCAHILSIAANNGDILIPLAENFQVLGRKKAPGRPYKRLPALQREPVKEEKSENIS